MTARRGCRTRARAAPLARELTLAGEVRDLDKSVAFGRAVTKEKEREREETAGRNNSQPEYERTVTFP